MVHALKVSADLRNLSLRILRDRAARLLGRFPRPLCLAQLLGGFSKFGVEPLLLRVELLLDLFAETLL